MITKVKTTHSFNEDLVPQCKSQKIESTKAAQILSDD
jgi:hypothetical protein